MSARGRGIVYLSGTRADFGLMRGTLQRIAGTPGLTLQLLVTGMHLSNDHGRTVDEIRASGLEVAAEIPVDMQTRSRASMSGAIADCLRGVTAVLERDPADLLLVLGDRGEMLAGAIAALHLGIPCVHVHGGERSGTVDEPVRHAISKLASYHLVATAESRERLVRMGEDAARIHVTGAPGLDGLAELGALSRDQCLRALGLPQECRFVLCLYHPVVQQAAEAADQTRDMLSALDRLGLPVVWLEPNADAGALGILGALDAGELPPGSRRFQHLPRDHFAAAMRHAEVLVGNSSAGIIEAATFGTPVVNVGDRQRLRERNANVADVPCDAAGIALALRCALEHGRWPCNNLYGDGRAGERIAGLLCRLPLGVAATEKAITY